jgi:membrane protease YdiL (CAAX protease family)
LTFVAFIAQLAEWLGVIAVTWLLSMSPRFRFRPLGFKYARRDGMAALSVAALIIVFSYAYGTTSLGPGLSRAIVAPAPASDLVPQLVLSVICLLPVIAALILRGQPVRSAGWIPATLTLGLQVGIALALLTIFLRNRVLDVLGGINSNQSLYLLFALGVALCEETIFRGYIQLRLVSWLGVNRGWVAAALLYAAWRLPAFLTGESTTTILVGAGVALVQGLVTGFLMRRTGNVLASSIYRAISIWLNVFV